MKEMFKILNIMMCHYRKIYPSNPSLKNKIFYPIVSKQKEKLIIKKLKSN